MSMKDALLIIDEAQLSYKYRSLWNDFLKPLRNNPIGPMVIFFSSYGSPAEFPVPTVLGSTPVRLSAQQRISVRPLSWNNPRISLYFTHQEFKDAVARACAVYGAPPKLPFILSPELGEYIWEVSNGHPGATADLLVGLAQSEVSFASLLQLFRFRIKL